VVVRTPPGAPPRRAQAGPNLWITTAPSTRPGFLLQGYRVALAVALRARPQVVTCQDPFSIGLVGYALARRLGLGLNLQVNGDVIDNPYFLGESRLYPAFNRLARWLLPRADTIRVSTSGERRRFLDEWGLPPERVWNIPFLVDFDRFLDAGQDGWRAELGVPPGAPMVLFLGRLVKAKDLGVLLRAIPRVLRDHPTAVFVLAGAGPEEAMLRHLAATLGIQGHLRFPGRIPYARVPSLYAAADAFVLCSHYEGTSMVTLEAAASGLPVVATDVAGVRDAVVDGVTGLVVPRRDSIALAGALSWILSDRGRAREMGARGRAYVLERFPAGRIARKMAEMWLATAALAR
jgi:glycosyltransferase involved in cell wall biosynthesis